MTTFRQFSESARALAPGQWVNRGATKVYEFDQPHIAPDTGPWPAIKLCAVCDTAHTRGEQCPTCLRWAEKAAQQWAWEQARFANRHVIWTILDARKVAA